MKREAITHTKMKRLCRHLRISLWQAVGLLESIWHLTARETPQGDLGKLTDDDIALAIEYGHSAQDAADLINALTEAGWLDGHPTHRLVVHGWSEHADDAVHLRLARARQHFVDGRPPKLTRLGGKEKRAAEAFYAPCAQNSDPCARELDPHAVRTPCAPPEPEPRQSQSPALPEPGVVSERALLAPGGVPLSLTTTPPSQLAELLPAWLDAEAQQRIWQESRTHAPDCTPEEVAAAVAAKIRQQGARARPGLLIAGVPKMFASPSGFLRQFRQNARHKAAEREQQRHELERIANDDSTPPEDRRWAREALGDVA